MPVVNGKKVSIKTEKPTGRPQAEYPDKWEEVYDQWKAEQITAVRAYEMLNLKKNTFYKLVLRFENREG